MFKHDNFRVDFNTADYSDLTFSAKDREVLRRLAGLVVRYGKKVVGEPPEAEVMIDKGASIVHQRFAPLADDDAQLWRI